MLYGEGLQQLMSFHNFALNWILLIVPEFYLKTVTSALLDPYFWSICGFFVLIILNSKFYLKTETLTLI